VMAIAARRLFVMDFIINDWPFLPGFAKIKRGCNYYATPA
jgi:hypothetical protein